jgi:hypothetical protein
MDDCDDDDGDNKIDDGDYKIDDDDDYIVN